MAMGYSLTTLVRLPAEQIFPLPHSIQTDSWVCPAFCSMGTSPLFLYLDMYRIIQYPQCSL
jgi:hypothetical protein